MLVTKVQSKTTMSQNQRDNGYVAIAQVEAYWEALRGDRLLPKRSDIDPRGIEQALANAFILERVAPGHARLRVAGSHLSELLDMEVRGMSVTAFLENDARTQVAQALEDIFQTPCSMMLDLVSKGGDGTPEIEGRMLILPLLSDLGDASRALGCFVTKGDIGIAPRRFDIRKMQLTPVKHPREGLNLAPEKEALQREPSHAVLTRGFEAPRADFAAQQTSTRPPYLRLVKSDD